jgi:hypothetical protein
VSLVDPATGTQLSMETMQNYFAWGRGPERTSILYASYAGKIWVIKTADVDDESPISPAKLAALHTSNPGHDLALAAKMAALANSKTPPPPQ